MPKHHQFQAVKEEVVALVLWEVGTLLARGAASSPFPSMPRLQSKWMKVPRLTTMTHGSWRSVDQPPPTTRGCRVARRPPVLCSCSGLAMAPLAPVAMDIRGSIGMLKRYVAWPAATICRCTSRWTPSLSAPFVFGIGIGEEVPGRRTAARGMTVWPLATSLHLVAALVGALRTPAFSLPFYSAVLSWLFYGRSVLAGVGGAVASSSGAAAADGVFMGKEGRVGVAVSSAAE